MSKIAVCFLQPSVRAESIADVDKDEWEAMTDAEKIRYVEAAIYTDRHGWNDPPDYGDIEITGWVDDEDWHPIDPIVKS